MSRPLPPGRVVTPVLTPTGRALLLCVMAIASGFALALIALAVWPL